MIIQFHTIKYVSIENANPHPGTYSYECNYFALQINDIFSNDLAKKHFKSVSCSVNRIVAM